MPEAMTRPIYDLYREVGYFATVFMIMFWALTGDLWEKP